MMKTEINKICYKDDDENREVNGICDKDEDQDRQISEICDEDNDEDEGMSRIRDRVDEDKLSIIDEDRDKNDDYTEDEGGSTSTKIVGSSL